MSGSCPVGAAVCREAHAEVERLRSAADSLFEKALERGAHGQVPAVNVVEISEAFDWRAREDGGWAT